MFAHTLLANTLVAKGMTKEEAKVELDAYFEVYGHFSSNRKIQLRIDALKEIAIWR
jgi:hypothetical protein